MKAHQVLILTDHTNHSSENSLYYLATTMLRHPMTSSIDIASRANPKNRAFFAGEDGAAIFATRIDDNFAYADEDHPLTKNSEKVDSTAYDLIWLRMPPPMSKSFLDYLSHYFQDQFIINNPNAIYETGSKEFLVNYAELCAPIQVCKSIDDIIAFKEKFPIVLKPFRDYGGNGIVKIAGDEVSIGNEKMSFETFTNTLGNQPLSYLGVKFLKNVTEGDKRIVVVNGEILGASLRLPAKDSWMCNVAQGGTSHLAEVDSREKEIIATINPQLSAMGIVMYGVDTLMGDDGLRVLSEINTTSIGGLPQIAALRNEPLVERAIALIWQYYTTNQ